MKQLLTQFSRSPKAHALGVLLFGIALFTAIITIFPISVGIAVVGFGSVLLLATSIALFLKLRRFEKSQRDWIEQEITSLHGQFATLHLSLNSDLREQERNTVAVLRRELREISSSVQGHKSLVTKELASLREVREESSTRGTFSGVHDDELVRSSRAARAWDIADRMRSMSALAIEPDLDAETDAIRRSKFFDEDWYRTQAGEMPADPVRHYVEEGALRDFSPHPLFDPVWYLEQQPTCLATFRTPLAHFIAQGRNADIDPHPAFDSRWYLGQVPGIEPDVTAALHYVQQGDRSHLNPNPFFDAEWYLAEYEPDATGLPPFLHYLTVGWKRGYRPGPGFRSDEVAARIGTQSDPLSVFLWDQRTGRLRVPPGEACHNEADWYWHHLTSGAYHEPVEPDTFALYRIIGNDLPPRHKENQTLENIGFILENEEEFENCQKHWIVNRIADPATEADIIALLDEHGASYIRIPFDLDEYAAAEWNFSGMTNEHRSYRPTFSNIKSSSQLRAKEHPYHYKNLYAINNNGARNTALEHGRQRATWVLPWDGNCFLTREAFQELRREIREHRHLRYFIVPMARLTDNALLRQAGFKPPAEEEPQVVFHRDAEESFDPNARYGHRPKVELFYRLGVPGRWDQWPALEWDPPRADLARESGRWAHASWVARLFSGEATQESNTSLRGEQRGIGIRLHLDQLDEQAVRRGFDSGALFTLDDHVLDAQRSLYRDGGDKLLSGVLDDIISRATADLTNPVYSVTTKTTLAPSGDIHDYWHPAPYWWPNPDTADGLPYVNRDGIRVPGSILGEEGSEQYDRTSLQLMIEETWRAALAGYFTGEQKFFDRGARLLRGWFTDPATRMNPHLEYSQVRMGHKKNRGNSTGIIETKDFYFLLDAARLIERSGAFGETDRSEFRRWFVEYRRWLSEGDLGVRERSSLNNHATWYDVQLAGIDAYLDDVRGLLETFRRVHERVGQHFDPLDGRQPEELHRTVTQHYCHYNIQAWMTLADFSTRLGHNLWVYETPEGSGLGRGIAWILDRATKEWPYEQVQPFDPERTRVLAHLAKVDHPNRDEVRGGERFAVKQQFTAHDGIRPYWAVGTRPEGNGSS
ncbi:alginate lyase family protein [Natronoglycomyces albus]|uniref:Alginate lyase family protein n=1 Tax=Natronoglycomyces albus TaxID=2811108 RepID=A0A895XTU8_9ACTN|nr:alginate lyase family protein [Natronoglycomyces albus]QSB05068.1 alginate lyase family protein [Natronoglycomyces albus]